MTELVEQRNSYDCTICCLAMLTNKSYEYIVDKIGSTFTKSGVANVPNALAALGYKRNNTFNDPLNDYVLKYRNILSPEFFRGYAWGRRALVAVPSRNFEQALHMIYWDGIKVYDPSTDNKYLKFEELKPEELILFNERKL